MARSSRVWLTLFALFVGAIVALFGLTNDAELEKSLLASFDALVSFVVGGGAGAAAGGSSVILARWRTVQGSNPQPQDLTWPLVIAVGVILVAPR